MLGNLTDVDLRMLRIFCSIVEAGGFTAAQARLNTSLPRLSVLVRDLEIRLGYSLCTRGKAGFQLTDEGQGTYMAAQELFADIDRFRQRTTALHGELPDFLLIGTVDSLITCQDASLSRAIALYRKGSPNTRLELHIMRPDELEQSVLEGRLQLAIGAFHHRLSGLSYEPMFEEEQNLYCSCDHPLFGRDDTTLGVEEISAADYVDRGYMAENRRPYDLRFSRTVKAFSMEAIATMILSGTYIGYLPTHYASAWVASGKLRALQPDRLSYRSEFHCATRQGQDAKPALTKFLQCLFSC
ncbi:LysR family transcriptional regulator [Pseudomonas aeruginosa]|uniref:LysR family transcriptional regulator n=1 Tax=Pseudomonas aeruginosa TaxID=287 RepID=UPI002E2C09AA|nr:LysR family transcriptional regulator [Pseudomonas aeruginosa]